MIGIIGINHETAPLDIRGKLSFNAGEIQLFFEFLKEHIEDFESVLVSTCNRTELYFSLNKSCGHAFTEQMISHVLEFKKLSGSESFDFYKYTETDAVRHLFKVASGLNSMVLGENQILGQLKEAYKISIDVNMAGSIMSRLFHKAFQAGKRVRSETDINKGASSVSYAAVELTHKVFSSLDDHPILLIGAGEAGDLVLQSLKERGSSQIEIINRTFSRAETLAEKYSARALPFDMLEEALTGSDIVVTSTASDKPIILEEQLDRVMKKRKNKMLLLIDLSVPRNIEESVRSMKNVFLFNLDDLQEVVAFNYSKRQSAIKKANIIVDELVVEFESWLSGLKLSPTIDQLKEKLAGMMENELNNLQSNVSGEELECLEKFSSRIHKKYLGLIIKNLKQLSDNGRHVEYIDLVNNLFDLKTAERNTITEEVKIGEQH
jgi:glutamyl-tRNA reductase